jgi:hypothetical protein
MGGGGISFSLWPAGLVWVRRRHWSRVETVPTFVRRRASRISRNDAKEVDSRIMIAFTFAYLTTKVFPMVVPEPRDRAWCEESLR